MIVDTLTAVQAMCRRRLPAGWTWEDVRRTLKAAARRYKSMNAEQRAKLRGEGA